MQKIGYDKKNNIFAVTTSGDDWDYYTIYFNDNLELLKVQEKFTGSYIFMFFS